MYAIRSYYADDGNSQFVSLQRVDELVNAQIVFAVSQLFLFNPGLVTLNRGDKTFAPLLVIAEPFALV